MPGIGRQPHSYCSYQRRQALQPPNPVQDEMLGWVKRIAQALDNTYGSRRQEKDCGKLLWIAWQLITACVACMS